MTAKDFELTQQQKFNTFQPASRATEEENDPKSLNKKLSRKLILTVKDPELSLEKYTLPSTTLQDGESLRIAAERLVHSRLWTYSPFPVFGSIIHIQVYPEFFGLSLKFHFRWYFNLLHQI